jgi:hypothetical protein
LGRTISVVSSFRRMGVQAAAEGVEALHRGEDQLELRARLKATSRSCATGTCKSV